MTATMRVVELPAVGSPLRLAERPVPEPGPGQALVRVQACGVCGSDVFLQKGGFGAAVTYPVVPGHEAAGVVASVGPGVEKVSVGDQVAVYYIDAPADSAYARRGRCRSVHAPAQFPHSCHEPGLIPQTRRPHSPPPYRALRP